MADVDNQSDCRTNSRQRSRRNLRMQDKEPKMDTIGTVIPDGPGTPMLAPGEGHRHRISFSTRKDSGNLPTRPSSPFLFGIVLKEIVAALHRIFLDPDGNIYPVLNDIIRPDVHDLSLLIHNKEMDAQQEGVLSQDLQSIVENLIFHVTEIMPTDGVLGTHKKSAVFELISGGKRFPDGYFWQAEMDLLQFNQYMRTVNVKDAEAFLLFLGIFISRSLITTILLKPKDYGLSAQPLSDVAERNLRVVATALLTLIRRMASTRLKGVMDLPREIAKYLYTDKEMEFVNRRLDRAYNFCEGLLREWGTEYIRRLRASAPGY